MVNVVVMPKLGNTVETSIISRWLKQQGEPVQIGDVLCEIETDKAALEVECPFSGTILAHFFDEGDDVPIMTPIVAIGEPGERYEHLAPSHPNTSAAALPVEQADIPTAQTSPPAPLSAPDTTSPQAVGISPRARSIAQSKGLDTSEMVGSGPSGRIIERDVQAALAARPRMTPLAKSMIASGDFALPQDSNSGKITSKDLVTVSGAYLEASPDADGDILQTVPLKGTRRIIASRMLSSLQNSAQLTMNAFADARSVMDYRKQLKTSEESLGLRDVTINDLLLFAAARTLPHFPDLNSLFTGESIVQYRRVHLGFAVDTPRGLIVPVVRGADRLSLRDLADATRRLSSSCQDGSIQPDDLSGGSFTVTNLGSLGIETFTPILNPPQVAILGVGCIHLKPVEVDGTVVFIPHIGLSLTINHQVVDGAPGARFLQALSRNLNDFPLLLAL